MLSCCCFKYFSLLSAMDIDLKILLICMHVTAHIMCLVRLLALIRCVQMLKALVDEWPGLLPYNTYAVCPTCDLQNLKRPQIWPLDFNPCHRVERTKHCMQEAAAVSASLLFPPAGKNIDCVIEAHLCLSNFFGVHYGLSCPCRTPENG